VYVTLCQHGRQCIDASYPSLSCYTYKTRIAGYTSNVHNTSIYIKARNDGSYIRGHHVLPPSDAYTTPYVPILADAIRLEAAMAPAGGSEEPYSGEASITWVGEYDVPRFPYGLWRVMSSGKKRQTVTHTLTE
jgi:hypothetical protein